MGAPACRIDFIGAALATLGFGLVAYGLSAETGESLGSMGLGFVILAGFLVWEARCPAPMIRLSMFRVRRFSTINLSTFLLYFAVTGIGFYLPMAAVSAWSADALSMSAAFLPGVLMIATLSTRMGKLADRIGPAPFLVGGAILVALAQAGLAITAHEALYWPRAVPLMRLWGFGMALLVAR